MNNNSKNLLLSAVATTILWGAALALNAQTAGTFFPEQSCFQLVPDAIPGSGSFNCADGLFAQVDAADPNVVVFLFGAYASNSPTVGYSSLSDLGYQPGTDPNVGINTMQITSTKFHDSQMYQNHVAADASITPLATARSNDLEPGSLVQCWFSVNDPTQAPGANIALNYNLGLSAVLGTPATGLGRVAYFTTFSVDDVTGPTPQEIVLFGANVFKFAGDPDPSVNGIDPNDVICVGDNCTVDATVTGALTVPNGNVIRVTSTVIGSISMFNSPGDWTFDSIETSVFTVTVDQTSNPNATLTLAATGQPGDFDNDGDVDGRDFLLWQRGGSPIPLSASDLAD